MAALPDRPITRGPRYPVIAVDHNATAAAPPHSAQTDTVKLRGGLGLPSTSKTQLPRTRPSIVVVSAGVGKPAFAGPTTLAVAEEELKPLPPANPTPPAVDLASAAPPPSSPSFPSANNPLPAQTGASQIRSPNATPPSTTHATPPLPPGIVPSTSTPDRPATSMATSTSALVTSSMPTSTRTPSAQPAASSAPLTRPVGVDEPQPPAPQQPAPSSEDKPSPRPIESTPKEPLPRPIESPPREPPPPPPMQSPPGEPPPPPPIQSPPGEPPPPLPKGSPPREPAQSPSTNSRLPAPTIEASQEEPVRGPATSTVASSEPQVTVSSTVEPGLLSPPQPPPTAVTTIASQPTRPSQVPDPVRPKISSSATEDGRGSATSTAETSVSNVPSGTTTEGAPVPSSRPTIGPSTTTPAGPFGDGLPSSSGTSDPSGPLGGPVTPGNQGTGAAPPSLASSRTSERMPMARIIGISVGSFAGLALLALLAWLWKVKAAKRRSRGAEKDAARDADRAAEENETEPGFPRLAAAFGLRVAGSLRSQPGNAGVRASRGLSQQFLRTAPVSDSVGNQPLQEPSMDGSIAAHQWARPDREEPGVPESLDPFSDAHVAMPDNAALSSRSGPTMPPTNPFADPGAIRPSVHRRNKSRKGSITYAPIIPTHSRGRSLSVAGRDSVGPPAAGSTTFRPRSAHRESTQSVESFADRRAKFRSDPFDLELESRLIPSAAAVAQMPGGTATSSLYSSQVSQTSQSWSRHTSRASIGGWTGAGAGGSVPGAATLELGRTALPTALQSRGATAWKTGRIGAAVGRAL